MSSGLINDLYQLTMAYGYWKHGLAEREAVFQLFFRRSPFGGGFTLAVGLETALEHLEGFGFDDEDTSYLRTLTGDDGKPLFEPEFLDALSGLRLACSIDGVAEASAVFPGEPVLRVRGPLMQAQLLETPLLNIINFQSLVATKAARVRLAAGENRVLEFGLRRAQGDAGGLAASRAAFIGGVDETSNTFAGREYGIPVGGTHAHSWVLAFDSEEAAMRAYAEAQPASSVLLVDTFDTAIGLERAVTVGLELRERGQVLQGVRLDSGDLLELSRLARARLDAAGLEETAIVASGDLDEESIADLKARGAPIDVWGVGTRLVTGHPDAALTGVYKLSALRDRDGEWRPRTKVSDTPEKATLPGVLHLLRFRVGERLLGDGIFDELQGSGSSFDDYRWPAPGLKGYESERIDSTSMTEPLWRDGARVGAAPTLRELRARAAAEVGSLPPGIRSLRPLFEFPVGLHEALARQRDLLLRGDSP